jgi:hypothetical protein
MNDELFRAFDECLSALEAGATLESALARYPHLAAELRPMLQAAQAARPTEILRVPQHSEATSRQRFLARARELKQKRPGLLAWWPTLAMRLVLVAIGVLLGGWGTINASASTLPGELLYNVKRAAEQAQLALTAPTQRASLQAEFNARRIAEIQTLLIVRREAEVEFTGVIAQTNGAEWVIARLPIRVPATLQTGLTVGDEVAVRARTQAEGTLLAVSLRLLRQGQREATATPTLAVTPTFTATPTRTQSATVEATNPITATRTPSPSRTASPTVTRTATPTLGVPTQTPQLSGTEAGNSNGNDDDDDNDNDDDDDDNDNSGGGSGPSPSNTPKP